MYKLNHDSTGVTRLSDGMYIPLPPAESEGFKYRDWLSEGNTPDPSDAPPPLTKEQRKDDLITAAGAKDILSVWAFIIAVEAKYPTMTPDQIYAAGNIAYCKCRDLKAALDAIDAEP